MSKKPQNSGVPCDICEQMIECYDERVFVTEQKRVPMQDRQKYEPKYTSKSAMLARFHKKCFEEKKIILGGFL